MAKRTMEIVGRIGQMNLEGNIIPHAWFNHLKFSNGKPNVNAAILLSEIVYWYRPITIKDEATGRVIETRRKFKADKLQRSYDSFAKQFGFTKRQVKEALKYLEDQGIITLEFRHITAQSGVKLANVLFIEPVPAKLDEITHLTLERNTSDAVASDIYSSNGTHLTTGCQTNTETPTETPTEGEGAEPPPTRDFLDDALEAHVRKGNGAGIADPSHDGDQWLAYRDGALATYKELTGLYADTKVGKPAICALAGEDAFDPLRWRKSVQSCRLAGVKPTNIGCMIDTYRAGGDYGMMQEAKRNGGKSPPPDVSSQAYTPTFIEE